MIRTYSELLKFKTFKERYNYLRLRSEVGLATFGHERYLNQRFYTSSEWRNLRNEIIVRDNGNDLASEDMEIHERIIIHHMNPVKMEDLLKVNEDIMNPEYLITTTHRTHNAIHYGDESLLKETEFVERTPNDHAPWLRKD